MEINLYENSLLLQAFGLRPLRKEAKAAGLIVSSRVSRYNLLLHLPTHANITMSTSPKLRGEAVPCLTSVLYQTGQLSPSCLSFLLAHVLGETFSSERLKV